MVRIEKIETLHSLLKLIEASIEASPGPRWFRGAGNYDHGLIPALFRHPEVRTNSLDPMTLESRLDARFKQTSPPFLNSPPVTALDWMFMAQHFGVPTRLLDWSENPFIALYFALSTSKQGSMACVWVLDPLLWTKRSLNNNNLPRIPDPADVATKRFIESLSDDLAPRTDPIAIYSNHTNPRVVAQRGTFTIFGRGTAAMESIGYAKDCLLCIVVEDSVKADLYNKLLSIGYTHSVIYPDLSGLGAELKTSFGF
ncbi:MAG: FRG domain-containing protein [Rhodocyclaceae bacterium]|nr:FRG domain-containing protein [Rhodocyclaceae bacterium]